MRKSESARVRPVICSMLTLLLTFVVTPFVPAAATDDLCESTIVTDFKLDRDLECAANGLSVGADGVRINLNGHSITGSGAAGGIGISVTGRHDVVIHGGTISNFALSGIRVNASTGVVIRKNELRDNGDGVDLQAGSRETTVRQNLFRGNTLRGIMLRTSSVDNAVADNTFLDNRVGILMFGAVDTVVKGNLVSGSELAGIRVNFPATRNLVADNIVLLNAIGIDFLVNTAVVPRVGPTGNTFVRNIVAGGACGLKGLFEGNVFKKNLLVENTEDVCSI